MNGLDSIVSILCIKETFLHPGRTLFYREISLSLGSGLRGPKAYSLLGGVIPSQSIG